MSYFEKRKHGKRDEIDYNEKRKEKREKKKEKKAHTPCTALKKYPLLLPPVFLICVLHPILCKLV